MSEDGINIFLQSTEVKYHIIAKPENKISELSSQFENETTVSRLIFKVFIFVIYRVVNWIKIK